MKMLMFGLVGCHANCFMAAEGGEGGGGSGAEGGEGGGGAGGTGADGGEGGLGALAGAGGQDDGGSGGDGGEIDWEKVTDADYMAKVTVPTVDGVTLNIEDVGKRYASFCRENKIAPEVMSKFLEMEGKYFAEDDRVAAEAMEKAELERKANFDAQGEALKRAYTAEQIGNAVKVISSDEFTSDKDFMAVATRELSNNPTLVKLLLNWGEHHQADTGTGAGSGVSSGDGRGFAARWTGKNI